MDLLDKVILSAFWEIREGPGSQRSQAYNLDLRDRACEIT
jgi:hypothetical protein